MRYEIIFAPEAVLDLKGLAARNRALVRDRIAKHLRYEPERISKSRIKRLRGIQQPHYRLRVNEYRIFYDVVESQVQILAIIPKSKAADWLKEMGEIR